MKYLIVGSGGVGGVLAAFLYLSGKDVSVIARGETYEKIKNDGITILSEEYGNLIAKTPVFYEDEYAEKPDVVFVTVKGYSLSSVIPFLKRVCDRNTTVIPLLNIFGTGSVLQKELVDSDVLDGCIYIMADIASKGVINHRKCEIRLVFGHRDGTIDSKLEQIKSDLKESRITPILSSNVKKDTFLKYTLISVMAAAGVYYDATVGEILDDPKKVEFFMGLSKEIEELGQKMGFIYDFSIPERNLKSMKAITKDGTTSLQKDLKMKKESEIDGLIYEVIRLGEKYGVKMQCYKKLVS